MGAPLKMLPRWHRLVERYRDDTATWALVTGLALFYAAYTVVLYGARGMLGVDAHAYWASGHRAALYGAAPQTRDAFLYSPAFGQLVRPLTWLPASAFVVVWIAAEAGIYLWLLRPLGRWAVPALCLCVNELSLGNVYAWFGLVIVAGFARPWLWAFPALTKIAPAQGLLWFAVRREWRSLATGVVTVGVVAAVSFVIWPHAWGDWVRFLADSSSGANMVRLAVACVVTVAGALTDRRWVLPLAVALACPVFNATVAVALVATLPRLHAGQRTQIGMPQPRQPVSFHQTST